jgi:hypothetical protein
MIIITITVNVNVISTTGGGVLRRRVARCVFVYCMCGCGCVCANEYVCMSGCVCVCVCGSAVCSLFYVFKCHLSISWHVFCKFSVAVDAMRSGQGVNTCKCVLMCDRVR